MSENKEGTQISVEKNKLKLNKNQQEHLEIVYNDLRQIATFLDGMDCLSTCMGKDKIYQFSSFSHKASNAVCWLQGIMEDELK